MNTSLIYADLIQNYFQLKRGNSTLVAQREGKQISFFETDKNSPLGYIFLGGPSSGAIYHGHELIGEFQAFSDQYVIRPVKAGRLDPNNVVEANPIDYCFTHIGARSPSHPKIRA